MAHTTHLAIDEEVRIDTRQGAIEGALIIPDNAHGVILFAHGSGSSRLSPRNRFVADELHERGFGTLLFDLLTASEEVRDMRTAEHRFDIGLLVDRLLLATDWLSDNAATRQFSIGYFGASTGAAAALGAAAERPEVAAVVSRGGRPDLAGEALPRVEAAALLIVGEQDVPVIPLNRSALARLERSRARELVLVPGATHLFEEAGALEEVARLAGDWFTQHVTPPEGSRRH
ncbi:MAG TPA: dienelactone hydrolase family protein [Lacipirellula sp.]